MSEPYWGQPADRDNDGHLIDLGPSLRILGALIELNYPQAAIAHAVGILADRLLGRS